MAQLSQLDKVIDKQLVIDDLYSTSGGCKESFLNASAHGCPVVRQTSKQTSLQRSSPLVLCKTKKHLERSIKSEDQ